MIEKLIEINDRLHNVEMELQRATPGNISHTAGNARVLIQAAIADMEPIINHVQSYKHFILKVEKMRRYQTAYFGSPPGETKQHNLQMAKHYEAEIDRQITIKKSKQTEMDL